MSDDYFGPGDLSSIDLTHYHEIKSIEVAAYESVPRARLRRVLLLEYRCRAHGCLLLHCWWSPQGAMFYKPGVKQSLERSSDESLDAKWKALVAIARVQGTSDGLRRWHATAGRLDLLPRNFALACDHLDLELLGKRNNRIHSDALKATPGKPTRRLF